MSLRLPTPGALAALAALLLSTVAAPARARLPSLPGPAAFAVSDTLGFRPAGTPPASARPADADSFNYSPAIQFFDSTGHEPLVVSPPVKLKYQTESEWLRAPMGDNLLDHPDAWESDHPRRAQVFEAVVDYNRTDLLRYGVHFQAPRPRTLYPRLGARFEYATGRKRTLYGIQVEQPLLP